MSNFFHVTFLRSKGYSTCSVSTLSATGRVVKPHSDKVGGRERQEGLEKQCQALWFERLVGNVFKFVS